MSNRTTQLKNTSTKGTPVAYVRDSKGKPVAAIVDLRIYRQFQKFQRQFGSQLDQLAKTYRDVPAETAIREIDAAVRHAQKTTRAR